ncbi:MAG: hypothetical protein Fur0037_05680 [Planctomycetota bacterium]
MTGPLNASNPAERIVGLDRPREAGPVSPSLEFRRILERMEEMARNAPDPGHEPAHLKEALRAADDSFSAAMDLRKRLEEAFLARRT